MVMDKANQNEYKIIKRWLDIGQFACQNWQTGIDDTTDIGSIYSPDTVLSKNK